MRTFNCGIGFVICVPADALEESMDSLRSSGETAQHIGQIVSSDHLIPGTSKLALNRDGHQLR